MVAREAGLLFVVEFWVLKSSAPSAHYRQVLGGSGLALGEPVVPRRVWASSVKLPEFLQTAYRKVVVWFFCSFVVAEPFDQVEDPFLVSPPVFSRGFHFLDVVLVRLFDVVGFSEYFSGVRRSSVFTGSVWLE